MADRDHFCASRILIVEDDEFIGVLYTDLLEELGHSVCAIATTERQAILAAAQHRPDFMLVDGSLREGSGLAAVEAIQRDGSVPHLFVSGDVGRIQALVPGANVLQKPFRIAELATAIQRVMTALPQN